MSDYYILITDAGAALEASAHASGTTVKLAKFSVCDGGVDFIPDPASTTFPNEFPPLDISSLTVSADDATVMVAQCIIPGSSGGYTIRGIAIYTDDGTLYATGNYPAQPKPAPESGFAASLEILAQLAVSDTADVSLSVTEGNFLTETQGNTLYLRQDKRLSEIADAGAEAQSAARDNLALGTAATATLTTSTTDSTKGHVLKIGDRGLGMSAISTPDGFDFSTYVFAAGETLLIDMSKATNIPGALGHLNTSFVYLNVTGVRDAKNGYGFILAEYFNKETWFCMRENDAGNIGWVINKLPTSAVDVGAMPLYPTPLEQEVDLNTLGALTSAGIYNQTTDAYAVPELNYPTTQAGTLLITPAAYGAMQEYTTFGSGQKFVRGLQSNFDGSGPWWPWRPQYSPGNPPDLSSYLTRADALNTFVQGFQFGAVTQVAVSGNQYPASPGCVLSAIQDNDTGNYPSFDSVDAVYQKPAQININGNWFTVAG